MMLKRLLALALVTVLTACATRAPVPEPDRAPKLKVRAHLAGTCHGRSVELFLLVDRSYRFQRQRQADEPTPVDAGSGRGEWAPGGSGYRMTTAEGTEWLLEPPLEPDPAIREFSVQGHPELDDCRLAEPP